jgi:putative ABC transport system substrate-binding protein
MKENSVLTAQYSALRGGGAMKNLLYLFLAVIALLGGGIAQAQQPTKMPHVGFLHSGSMSARLPHVEGFRRGLRERGYVEGKNIIIEYRFAEGKLDQLPELAAELVRLNVAVIAAPTTRAMLAAKKATTTIPIVMVGASDPLGAGLVASLARPGANVTGLSLLAGELSGKRLELLKEAVPGAVRMAALTSGSGVTEKLLLKETEDAARGLGIQLQIFEARDPQEFESAFSSMTRARASAVSMMLSPLFDVHIKRIAELAAASRLAAMYGFAEFPEVGGLMSYGTDLADIYRRAAVFVDKILKGTKPEDLPVEQPTKFEFVINLKTAKQIGLTIPPNVLARADRVIR